MKFTQKWKNFWQIQKHTTGGFTLVELIVVIAILAILAGIGVPAYSGYIEKANKAADEQIISDVKQALELAGYAGKLTQAGYVLLSTEPGVASDGEDGEIAAAMESVFGSNWEEAVKLKWDGWEAGSDAVNAALALSEDKAKAIGASSYLTNSSVGGLLGDVQTVTAAAAEFLGNKTKTPEDFMNALDVALTTDGDEGYMEMAVTAGLATKNEDGSYTMKEGLHKDGKLTAEAQNQFSNLMVMSVAKEMEGMNDQELINTLTNVSNPTGGVDGKGSVGNQLAVAYSMILAYELSDGEDTSERFDALNAALYSNSLNEIQTAFQTYMNGNPEFMDYMIVVENGQPKGLKDAAKTDFKALTSIMSGVNAVSGNYTNKDVLANGELMTSGDVANDVNAFVGAAAMKASGLDVSSLAGHTDGPFVYFTPDASKLFVVGSSVG